MTTSSLDTASATSEPAKPSLAARVWRMLALNDRLGRRAGVVLWTSVSVGLGLALSWNWLVAAGLSSTVVALLPCAAMCALGLCGGSGKGCARKDGPHTPPDSGRRA